MTSDDTREIANALDYIARSLGAEGYSDGNVSAQLAELGKATEKVADALDRIADAISGK